MNNIAENPRGLSFQQVNAEVLPTVLDSVDVAVINGNYAIARDSSPRRRSPARTRTPKRPTST